MDYRNGNGDYEDDEEDDEEECDEEEEEYDGSSHGSETRREIFGFANSLTAKGKFALQKKIRN